MIKFVLGSALLAAVFLSAAFAPEYAQASERTHITSIDGIIGLEETVLDLNVPEDNRLPWAFVDGKIANPVPEYPVIIQIYDDDIKVDGNDMGAVHFAQTKVNPDGTYEYRFRVVDTIDGELVNTFSGDYTVKVFKVVYMDQNLNAL